MVLKVLKNFWLKNVDGQDHMMQKGMVIEAPSNLYSEVLKQVHASRILSLQDYENGKDGAVVKASSRDELSNDPKKSESSMIVKVGEPPLVEVVYSDNPRVHDKITMRDVKEAKEARLKSSKKEADLVVEMPANLPKDVTPEPQAEDALVEKYDGVEMEASAANEEQTQEEKPSKRKSKVADK